MAHPSTVIVSGEQAIATPTQLIERAGENDFRLHFLLIFTTVHQPEPLQAIAPVWGWQFTQNYR
ncbi:MAG TPA: hypothetical protein DCZ55_30950 [Cyanobacteria bacterium UBA11371]|nr:hypothetical protein [Cyanobacteria bacterium UBA11371]